MEHIDNKTFNGEDSTYLIDTTVGIEAVQSESESDTPDEILQNIVSYLFSYMFSRPLLSMGSYRR